MARWLVPLAGERIDLEEFPRWFPNGEIRAIEEGDRFYLVGSAFEALSDAEGVLNEARRALGQFTAIISLLWPDLKGPKIDGVTRETDEGKRNQFLFMTDGFKVRAKRGDALIEGESISLESTQAQDMLRRARGNSHLEAAITLWGDPMRSWSKLYRILEEIEQHLGVTVQSVGFCSKNERERFTRTANSAEVAGDDARHATGKYDPPPNPMTREEADRFIGRLLRGAFQ